jgi:hypothetical protein
VIADHDLRAVTTEELAIALAFGRATKCMAIREGHRGDLEALETVLQALAAELLRRLAA